jgi:pimeloyl-ACP methyl ester carboxylesterase
MSTAGADDAARVAAAITDGQDPRTIPQHPVFARRIPQGLHEELMADADRTDLAALRGLFRSHWELSSRAHLATLPMPVTLLNGRFERLFQPEVDWIRANATNIEIVELDAGHSPNLEAAAAFDAAALAALGG